MFINQYKNYNNLVEDITQVIINRYKMNYN